MYKMQLSPTCVPMLKVCNMCIYSEKVDIQERKLYRGLLINTCIYTSSILYSQEGNVCDVRKEKNKSVRF